MPIGLYPMFMQPRIPKLPASAMGQGKTVTAASATVTGLGMPVEITPGTPIADAQLALQAIKNYPWGRRRDMQQHHFTVVLCPSLKSGYESHGIGWQKDESLQNDVAVTLYSKKQKEGLVIIPLNPDTRPYIENLVNHEFSHAWDLAHEIRQDAKVSQAYEADLTNLYARASQLSQPEQELIKFVFPSPQTFYDEILANPMALVKDLDFAKKINEITTKGMREAIADLSAWQLGKGVYGSGLALYPQGLKEKPLVVVQKDLILKAFPTLGRYLKSRYEINPYTERLTRIGTGLLHKAKRVLKALNPFQYSLKPQSGGTGVKQKS